jgi:hypothetical protein
VTGDGKLVPNTPGTKRSLGPIDVGEVVNASDREDDFKRFLGTIDLGEIADGSDSGDFVNLLDEAGVEGSVNITVIVDTLMAWAVGLEGRGLNPVGTDGGMPRQEVEV